MTCCSCMMNGGKSLGKRENDREDERNGLQYIEKEGMDGR